MSRFLTATFILAIVALASCSVRLLVDGDLNADSTRPHPAPVVFGESDGD